MNTIKHTEYKHNGSRVILDTCELTPGKYETMLLYPNGHEIACRTARTEAEHIDTTPHIGVQLSQQRKT